jgi:hypothetical protein
LRENNMHDAARLLEQHFQTLVNDNESWKKLIADDILWQLPYAPALGHPLSLDGRDAVERHVGWFLSAVENFRFHDLRILASALAMVARDRLLGRCGRRRVAGRVLITPLLHPAQATPSLRAAARHPAGRAWAEYLSRIGDFHHQGTVAISPSSLSV